MDECMLNDLLECSVCLERLDTSSKVLPCQHTFCKKCLEEIVSTHRELRCPECRVLVEAKVDDLPPNVLLMRILEGMRNAAPKSSAKSLNKGNPGTQRLFGGHQISSVPVVSNSPAPASFANEPVRHANATAKQAQLYNQTYGRAIYDYVSIVPGDLSFKKGDIVILRKKIDNNWCFGESANSHGVFPLSYVQVMTPLTQHVPQCKALYDFRMTNGDEDGCLTFNKGEVISVIRRVDENWAEGKLLDRIGIFPLAFVELNSVARALMKLSTNAQPGPSRLAPPTPTNEETTPLIPTDHSRNLQTSQPRPQHVQNTMLPVSDSVTSASSGGSSSTTTPNTPNSSTTSSSSSTAPSSPSSPATSPPAVGNRHNVKRHSFTSVNTGHQVHPHHRHSAEILSPPTDNATSSSNTSGNNDTFSTQQTGSNLSDHNVRHRRSGSSDLTLVQSSQVLSSAVGNTHLPAAYIALYPYKPQKADELELRKGGIYMVTERCQDGWFKGTSNRTQKCGVFPGNYVAPAKFQLGLCRGPTNTGQQHQSFPSSTGQSSTDTRTTVTYTKNKGPAPQSYNLRTMLPPELPPRAISPFSMVSSSWHGQSQAQNQESNPPPQNEQNTGNPLGRSHSAVMSSNISSPGKQIPLLQLLGTTGNIATSNNGNTNTTCASSSVMNEMNKSPTSTLHGVTASSSATPASGSRNTEKKEKREKCVSLMRRGPSNAGQHQTFPSSTSQSNTESRTTVTYTKNKEPSSQSYNVRTLLPPELPPRAISPSSAVSSSWHNQSQQLNQENSPPSYTEQNTTNPLGRSHSAVMSSNIWNGTTTATATTSSVMNERNKSPTSNVHVVASPSSTSAPATKNPEKQKEKRDKCVSLMRRLTNIKKSKSPPPTTYSMDNPVFDDGNSINPVHVRSGSCPSQLLQVGATQELNATNNHHRLCSGTVLQAHVTSSQRLKYKERPSLPVSILQRSNESGGTVCAQMGSHHRKSNSLDAGMGKQMKQQTARERERVYRFRCIVPYPPNSEFELELRVGDIIYVHKKRDDGWYKGTQQRTGRTGLFPASFVEAF